MTLPYGWRQQLHSFKHNPYPGHLNILKVWLFTLTVFNFITPFIALFILNLHTNFLFVKSWNVFHHNQRVDLTYL